LEEFKKFSSSFLESKLIKIKIPDDIFKTLILNSGTELNLICSQVGGILAQEILKAISRDAKPIENYFVFDGLDTFSGFIETING
jgi:hypothetical protein